MSITGIAKASTCRRARCCWRGAAPSRTRAFSYGERAFGVQFHPEMTPETMERWVTNEKAQRYFTLPEVPSADRQRADAPRYDPAVHRWLDGFLDTWLERF